MTFSRTRPANHRAGLTLIEIMIALTMTLIVLGAMMQAFSFASQEMQKGRGVMEMSNRLRSAEELLRNDLANLTVEPRPYTSTNPNGYNTYIEGPQRDLNYPYTAVDNAPADRVYDGILDSDGDLIPDPIDVDITGGFDANGNGIDDSLDPTDAFTQVNKGYKGDHDDIWAGTVRSDTRPYRGRYIAPTDTTTIPGLTTRDTVLDVAPVVVESPLAEVIWWTDYVDNGSLSVEFSESVKLYRRVLVIRPDLLLPAFATLGSAREYQATIDVSSRVELVTVPGGTYFQVVANSLEDLAHRQNRFATYFVNGATTGSAFPHTVRRNTLWLMRSADYTGGAGLDFDGDGIVIRPNGDDVMLTDVAGFDIKAYSPAAAVLVLANHPDPNFNAPNVILEPDDYGYRAARLALPAVPPVPPVLQALGAYTDLGHPGGSWFSGFPAPKSQLIYQYRGDFNEHLATVPPLPVALAGLMDVAFDTWTPLYESDGFDQDGILGIGNTVIDQGTNGVDNSGDSTAPDDNGERETNPPYASPLRGIKVSIRLVEKTTRQVHQSSVIQSYVPE